MSISGELALASVHGAEAHAFTRRPVNVVPVAPFAGVDRKQRRRALRLGDVAIAVVRRFVDEGVHCPRKILIRSDTLLIDQPNPSALDNVNTPDDL